MMDEADLPTNVFIGPRWEAIAPGSDRFSSLCKGVQTATSRTGELSHNHVFTMLTPPNEQLLARDLAVVQEKLRQAHQLLLGATAILQDAHKRAKRKTA